MVCGVGQFNYASHIWLGHTLVSMATKICDFQHKIGYDSACVAYTPQILAPTRGFLGSANRGVATGVDIGIYTPKISQSKLFMG